MTKVDPRFKKLFEPIQLGSLTVPNRIYMPSMCVNYCGPDGQTNYQEVAYFEARAKGGAGLITIDYSLISPEGKGMQGQKGLYDDKFMPDFTRVVDVIKARGAKATTQLHHAGLNAMVENCVGPSAITNRRFFITKPRALATEEVEELVEKFADAALRGKNCGLDMVEVHATHGYLVAQFLSPRYNQGRNDKYGNDRALFAVEIVQRIKEKCGADFPVAVRLVGDEFEPGGIDIEYAKGVAKRLELAGADLLHVTGGTYDTIDFIVPSMYREDEDADLGFYRFIKLGSEIKKVVNTPVASGGLLEDPVVAERVLEEGLVDMVFIGKQLIADPEWPNKVRSGRIEDIKPCTACMDGCIGRIFQNQYTWCCVNPINGFEFRWPNEDALPRTLNSKKVLVVGAGPAGLEAARVCTIRGHKVKIIEKGPKIGGAINIAAVPSFRKRMRKLVDWYQRQMDNLGIEIQLNTEVDEGTIKKEKPDALVIASGSESIMPDLPGIEKAVIMDDVYLGKVEVGKRVVIIGAGRLGMDTGYWLAKQYGKEVTILARRTAGADIDPAAMSCFFNPGGLVETYKLNILTNTPATAVTDKGVEAVDALTGELKHLAADTVIVAMGRKSVLNDKLGADMEEEDVHVIGDAQAPRRVMEAIHEGFFAAMDI